MSDMMRFLAANIGTRQTPLKDILDYTHSPRILFDNKKYGKASIALGWMVSPLDKESTSYVWQEGLTGGFASFIGFVETNHTGVVILSNSAIPVSDIGKNILQKLR
jgi:CubicO group peptidase (beta-lactamase class C family)